VSRARELPPNTRESNSPVRVKGSDGEPPVAVITMPTDVVVGSVRDSGVSAMTKVAES
jgi:hypothetical protein